MSVTDVWLALFTVQTVPSLCSRSLFNISKCSDALLFTASKNYTGKVTYQCFILTVFTHNIITYENVMDSRKIIHNVLYIIYIY